MTHPQSAVAEVFVELADTLVTDFDLIDFLQLVSVRSAQALSVQAVGLLLAHTSGDLNVVAASCEAMPVLDLFQLQTGEGLENMKKGDQITIAIRPERFNFAAQEKKANVLDCKIENITFLGSVVRIQVAVGSNRFYMDTFNNPFLELPKIGAQDQVTCSREAVLVLKS